MPKTLPVVDMSAPVCCSPVAAGPLDDNAALEIALRLKALADPVRLRKALIRGGIVGNVQASQRPRTLHVVYPSGKGQDLLCAWCKVIHHFFGLRCRHLLLPP